ncbi:hypothetical protein C0J52_10342 [Blattella germanica]|nr:hypothetical protein C0J52_10342 [Blattella germanica]
MHGMPIQQLQAKTSANVNFATILRQQTRKVANILQQSNSEAFRNKVMLETRKIRVQVFDNLPIRALKHSVHDITHQVLKSIQQVVKSDKGAFTLNMCVPFCLLDFLAFPPGMTDCNPLLRLGRLGGGLLYPDEKW